jgi:hypothetical protein
MTDLTLETMWQDAPAQMELREANRKAREARANTHWHPTTPERESLLTALQVLKKETSK